ncbi:MAG: hypothetical protein EAX96_18695 [Candidatus Lokiarchaeota archaeon]|nr:hypothetical protein [Candidatus Lokiarchaeota archaeon]
MEFKDPEITCIDGHTDTLMLYFSPDFKKFSYICVHCSEKDKIVPLNIIEQLDNSIKISINNKKILCPENHESDNHCYMIIRIIPEIDIAETFYYCSKCDLEFGIELVPEDIYL